VNSRRTEVIKIDQLNSGSSLRFIEKQRMLRIVRKKLRDVNAEDKPETSRPVSRKYIEDGDKDKKEVDRGGYNVQPVPAPYSETREKETMT
jgi:hypothetical protein